MSMPFRIPFDEADPQDPLGMYGQPRADAPAPPEESAGGDDMDDFFDDDDD